MLLVEESSVEEVPFVGAELEGFCEVFDLLEDPLGAGIVFDAFAVAVPEFDVVSGEYFDEAAGVVVLKLGDPSHVEVDSCLTPVDAVFSSRGEDILCSRYGHGHGLILLISCDH